MIIKFTARTFADLLPKTTLTIESDYPDIKNLDDTDETEQLSYIASSIANTLVYTLMNSYEFGNMYPTDEEVDRCYENSDYTWEVISNDNE